MLLKTIHKLLLAKIIFHFVFFFRKLFNLPVVVSCQRNEINWELDLREVVDLTIYVLGYFEPDVTYFYLNQIHPGDTVLDIGANSGPHTLVFARLVGEQGKVLAVEPTQFAYNKLQKNISLNLNLAPRIRSFHCGLVAAAGAKLPDNISASFRIDTRLDDEHRNKLDCGYAQPMEDATFLTLDQLVTNEKLQRLDWIKLDVDGHEVKVLKGAQDTLKKFKPKILIELSPIHFVDPAEPFEEVIRLLIACNYRLKNINGKILPESPEGIKACIPYGALITAIATVDNC